MFLWGIDNEFEEALLILKWKLGFWYLNYYINFDFHLRILTLIVCCSYGLDTYFLLYERFCCLMQFQQKVIDLKLVVVEIEVLIPNSGVSLA